MTYDKSIFPRPVPADVDGVLEDVAEELANARPECAGLVSDAHVLAAEVLALREENERLRARLARVAELKAALRDEGDS